MSRIGIMRRWQEEFAAEHDGLSPMGVTLRRSSAWDRKHANTAELGERESDSGRLWQAYELYGGGYFSAAFQIWSELADQGSVWSMLEIGRCYENGCGAKRDLAQAENWYQRAFAGGSQFAMLKCAEAVASRKDYTSCEAVLQVGIEQDWTPAIFWLAWYRHAQSESRETYRDILPMLTEAAKRGHPAARMYLAYFMVRGRFGLLRVPLGLLLAIRTAVAEMGNLETGNAQIE